MSVLNNTVRLSRLFHKGIFMQGIIFGTAGMSSLTEEFSIRWADGCNDRISAIQPEDRQVGR